MMTTTRTFTMLALGASLCSASLCTAGPGAAADFHEWAESPPMGWNSWDCFGTTVTKQQTREQTDFMAAKLRARGGEHIVVDIQWYQPTSTGHEHKEGAKLAMDGEKPCRGAGNVLPRGRPPRGTPPPPAPRQLRTSEAWTLAVNGTPVQTDLVDGFARIPREWDLETVRLTQKGDSPSTP